MVTSSRMSRFLSEVFGAKYLLLPLVIAYLLSFYFFCITKAILILVFLDLMHKYITTPADVKNGHKWKVVIAGAGMSGLCMAKKLLDVGITNIIILEKTSTLGGAWNLNKYPGLACDRASHAYSFSFFLNPWWSQVYSPGNEIWNHLTEAATHFNLNKHIKYRQTVSKAIWDEEKKMWNVTTEAGDVYEANFFVQASGGLHVLNKPEFKSQEQYKKPIIHTGEWDPSVDLKGKRVAIIGSSATGVQLVPGIADKVKELHLFQRTPHWIPPRNNKEYAGWIKYLFAWLPWSMLVHRWYWFFKFDYQYLTESILRSSTHRKLISWMSSSLNNDPALTKAVIPDYEPGFYRRLSYSDSYLKALTQNNVHVITNPIMEFTEEGIRTKDGNTTAVDLIILATGYKILSSLTRMEIYGRNKRKLAEDWGDTAIAYLATTYPGYPNFFIVGGPGSGIRLGSILFMIECEANYALDCIRKLSNNNSNNRRNNNNSNHTSSSTSVEVKPEPLAKYIKWLKMMKGTDKSPNPGKQGGFPWPMWPKSGIEFWWSTYSCNKEDYIFE